MTTTVGTTRRMHYRVGEIQPNPFRRVDDCPLDEGKVGALRESLRATGWWENVVARVVDGVPQLAYGHHRLEALRQELGEDTEVRLIIRHLSDDLMLRMMVRENMEEWAPGPRTHLASVRAVVDAYAAGTITLPAPAAKTPKATLRHAPSYLLGHVPGPDREDRPYTVTTLTSTLGWDRTKIEDTLAALALIEQGLHPNTYDGLTLKAARFVTRQVHQLALTDTAWLAAYAEEAHRCREAAVQAPDDYKGSFDARATLAEEQAVELRDSLPDRMNFIALRAEWAFEWNPQRADEEIGRLVAPSGYHLKRVRRGERRGAEESPTKRYLEESAPRFTQEVDALRSQAEAEQLTVEESRAVLEAGVAAQAALDAFHTTLRTRHRDRQGRVLADGAVRSGSLSA